MPSQSRREHPRHSARVKVRLSLTSRGERRAFQANLETKDISVGGMFLTSTFFLRVGQELDVAFDLPRGRRVHCRGKIVRVEQMGPKGKVESGFAIKFLEYFDQSDLVLANYLLGPVLERFVRQYAERNGVEATPDWLEHVMDVLSEWELHKAMPDPTRNGRKGH